MKSKYGIFDSNSRKIVGVLNLDDGAIIEINGKSVTLEEVLADYNGCDVTITVVDNASGLTQE